MEAPETPPGHTPGGGVLIGSEDARRSLVIFEDPQCPYCRKFEDASGDLLRREMFANQPREHSGGFSTQDLLDLGHRAGLTGPDYVSAVQTGRYEPWVREIDEVFEEQVPSPRDEVTPTPEEGTPFAMLDGRSVDADILYDPDRLGASIRA